LPSNNQSTKRLLSSFWDEVKAGVIRTKSISQALADNEGAEHHPGRLKRLLGPLDLLAIGVGATIGAGIFVLTGQVAKNTAGPAIALSYFISGVACVFSGLAYTELAARIPVAGSAYLYSYCTLGEWIAWFVGWELVLEYVLSVSAVAKGWSGYVVALFGGFNVTVPDALYHIPYGCHSADTADCQGIDILAFTIVLLLTTMCAFGTKGSSNFNIIMLFLSVAIILFVIFAGASLSDASNYQDFFPYGAFGVFEGSAVVFFAYFGFDTVSSFSEEVKNPQRDLPIGIIGSVTISTLLYCGVALVVCGMVYYADLDENAPLSMAFAYHGWQWAQIVVSFGAFVSLTTSILATVWGMPRIFLAMARDGLIFPIFKYIHPKYNTPVFGTYFTGIISGLIALFFDLGTLSDMVSIGTLMAFLAVCAGVIILRMKSPTNPLRLILLIIWIILTMFIASISFVLHAPIAVPIIFLILALIPSIYLQFLPHYDKGSGFICPFVPLIPLLGIYCNIYLISNLSYVTWLRWLAWFAVGTVFYLCYGLRFSKQKKRNQDYDFADAISIKEENLILENKNRKNSSLIQKEPTEEQWLLSNQNE